MINDSNQGLLDRISSSPVYKDYVRAFTEATGLPLRLTPVDDLQLAHHGRKHENPFCALMAKQNESCAACLQTQHQLATNPQSQTVTCFADLCESAIPVHIGEKVIGYLRTGEVLLHQPTKRSFSRVEGQCRKWGLKVDINELREAYFQSRVLSAKHYESMLQLLRVFAQHLSIVANQVVFRSENAEPPVVTRAREFIMANHTEDLSLSDVAKAVHMSTFYFCKQFKKATGFSFTNYLSRLRVEKAKQQLLNPNARVSEVAFEVGFQSLTHFNRVFHSVVGESPTEYRTASPLAHAA